MEKAKSEMADTAREMPFTAQDSISTHKISGIKAHAATYSKDNNMFCAVSFVPVVFELV